MAKQHIDLQGNETRLAGQFRAFVDNVRRVQDEARHMVAVMDEAGAAAPADWTAVRSVFGFQSDADAQAAYTLLKNAATQINHGAVDSFTSRIGQVRYGACA